MGHLWPFNGNVYILTVRKERALIQGHIQLLSKVGVHIRHTITRGVGGHAPSGKKLIFGKNTVHFL